MKREIYISDFSKTISFDARRLKRFVHELDANLPDKYRAPEGSFSIAFFTDKDLAKIHADFLNKPSETDVITFEGDRYYGELGEVCVSAERALKCAAAYGFSPAKELCLYVAHGYLHLAGIDDIAEEDALIMRAAEAEAMKILDKKFRKPIFKFNV